MDKSLFSILVSIPLVFMFESCYNRYKIDDNHRICWEYEIEDKEVAVYVCNLQGDTLGGFRVDNCSNIIIIKYRERFHVMEEYYGWHNTFDQIFGDSLFQFYVGKPGESLYREKFFVFDGKDELGYDTYKYKKLPFIKIEFEDNYTKTYDDINWNNYDNEE